MRKPITILLLLFVVVANAGERRMPSGTGSHIGTWVTNTHWIPFKYSDAFEIYLHDGFTKDTLPECLRSFRFQYRPNTEITRVDVFKDGVEIVIDNADSGGSYNGTQNDDYNDSMEGSNENP